MPRFLSIFDQGLRYRLFLIFCQLHQEYATLEFRKCLALTIEKTKGTLFSQTLKVEGVKMPFVLAIFDQGIRYGKSKNLLVFPFAVSYCKRTTLKVALLD